MNTEIKTCNKCGWVVPMKVPIMVCPACKTLFTEGYCRICLKYSPRISRNMCPSCLSYVNTHYCRTLINATDKRDSWLIDVAKIPRSYHTLTEDEWIEACKFFNKCAFCTENEITTRSFFIPFNKGGRYCNWNVIPTCDFCSNSLALQQDPFVYLHKEKILCFKVREASIVKVEEYLYNKLKETGYVQKPLIGF